MIEGILWGILWIFLVIVLIMVLLGVWGLVVEPSKERAKYAKAIADYSQAVAVSPNLPDFYEKLAWLYATCPYAEYRDGKKAFKNATKAVHLTCGKDWNAIDTLAAAYAENGNFAAAIKCQVKAIELAKTDKSEAEIDKYILVSHLESYEQQEPWREDSQRA